MSDPSPIEICAIDHVVLRVINVERMLGFYCDVLGCKVERNQETLGLVQLRAGSSLIDLVSVDGKLGREGGVAPGNEGRNVDHICFRLTSFDADAITSRLKQAGCDPGPAAQRYGAEGVGASIYCKDPEGNTIELKAPGVDSSNI